MRQFYCEICGCLFNTNGRGRERWYCEDCKPEALKTYFRGRYHENAGKLKERSRRYRSHLTKIGRWYRKIGRGLMVVLPVILEEYFPRDLLKDEDMIEIMKALKDAPKEEWYE